MDQPQQDNGQTGDLHSVPAQELAAQQHSFGDSTMLSMRHQLNVQEAEMQLQNEELLRIQNELAANLREYEKLFEFSPSAYFILDLQGNIEKVNLRGVQYLGIEKQNLIGMPFVKFVPGEARQDQFDQFRKRTATIGIIERMELELMRGDGSVFPALIKGTTCGEGAETKHLLAMISDISRTREHERKIQADLDKAEELNEMKSRFVAMASHEFRTPLSTILSSTSLAEKYADTDQKDNMKRHLSKIKNSVSQLTMILDEFLSLEKIESGKVDISPYCFDIQQFCQTLIEETRSTMKSGQQINYLHVGETEIFEDKAILRHVLLNLLTNACKYSPQDKEIDLFTTVDDATIEIKVRDHGIGIPEDEQANVFSRFFRAKNVATIQGTGLGLNIVKRYVELLNGNIHFTSRPQVGSTFVVRLPRIAER